MMIFTVLRGREVGWARRDRRASAACATGSADQLGVARMVLSASLEPWRRSGCRGQGSQRRQSREVEGALDELKTHQRGAGRCRVPSPPKESSRRRGRPCEDQLPLRGVGQSGQCLPHHGPVTRPPQRPALPVQQPHQRGRWRLDPRPGTGARVQRRHPSTHLSKHGHRQAPPALLTDPDAPAPAWSLRRGVWMELPSSWRRRI